MSKCCFKQVWLFGEQVLAICQSLYETHKLTSYPRSDSSYLPESQHADAPQILASLRVTYPGNSC
ncbi:DNA topoisomerase [Klebsiella quasipneumoniae]|uniref:DNA topoisomerase n=1 Tax=Klebsiella quasipneumoniae TaxID=1463165 RepID=UPI00388D4F3E